MSALKGKHHIILSATFALFFSSHVAAAEPKTIRINKIALPVAERVAALDEELRLKKLLLFPSVDDVSGVLTPTLDAELARAVAGYTRFDLVRDQDIIKALKTDGEGYSKVARADSVHKEAIKAAVADASLLLLSETVGGNLQLTLEMRDRSGQVLLSESEKIPAFSSKDARSKRIATMFAALAKKIPFAGTVTGRSGKTITLDLGRDDLKVGDELEVARLTSVQRHPLLKTLVNTDYTKVGTAKVTSVDKVMSFAEISQEASGEAIATNNKIVAFHGGSGRVASEPGEQKLKDDLKYSIKQRGEEIVPLLEGELDRPMPQFGYVTADVGYGTMTHEHAVTAGSNVEASGSGFGASLAGELWVTKNWAAGAGAHLQSASLDSTSTGNSVSLGSASWNKFQVYGGYRMIPGKLDELSILFGIGYSSVKVNLPNNSTLGTGPRTYSGLLFKVDGDILILPKNKLWVGMELIPFGGFEETGSGLGEANSVSDVGLRLDWLKEVHPNLWGRLGFKIELANASATGGGTDSEKRFIFGPGILYYF